MSIIDSIIKAQCPDGVEYISLGEFEDRHYASLGRGKIISKKDMLATPGDYPVYSSSATGDGEIGRYGEYMFDDERITWSIDGGGKLFYRNNLKYSVTNVGGYIKLETNSYMTKFLYYVLLSQWEKKTFDYTKKAHPSVIRDEYEVPLVPYEAQEKIVKIIDTFNELIETLETELSLREKQFNYYKDIITSGTDESRFLTLNDVCQIIDCPHSSPKWQSTGVPVIRNYNLVNGVIDTTNLSYVSEEEYIARVKRVIPQENDILFSREAPIGNVGIIPSNFKCCQGQRVVLLRADSNTILPRYLLHVLQGNIVKDQINKVEKVGSTVSNFNISDLRKLKFYVPSIDEQKDIIKQLDIFHTLLANIEYGLPSEIRSRNLQLRYYRDKLLSFKRIGDF